MNDELETMTEDQIHVQIRVLNAELERRTRQRTLEAKRYLKEKLKEEELEQFLINFYEELQREKNPQKEEQRHPKVNVFEKASNRTPRSLGFMDKPRGKTEPEVIIQGHPDHPMTKIDGKAFLEDMFGLQDQSVTDTQESSAEIVQQNAEGEPSQKRQNPLDHNEEMMRMARDSARLFAKDPV